MTNLYYDFEQPFIPGTKVRSDDVNREYTLIEQAFDLLPDPESLATGSAGLGTESGSGNSYVLTLDNPRVVNLEGDQIVFKATHQNSGAATIAVDGIAAVPLVRFNGDPVQSGDILNGAYYEARYNSGSFYIVSPAISTVVGVITYATPTALVGLSAIAGVATTVMRSDAAPALNQGIVPTWTGIHTFSLRTLFADGTVLLPGLSFGSDTDTGFYRVGANSLGVAVAGALAAAFNSTNFQVTDGSAGAPSLTFLNDTDTGLYRGGTNDIRLAVGGVNFLTVNPSLGFSFQSLVGIPDGAVNNLSFYFNSDVDTGIYRAASNRMRFVGGGAVLFDLDGVANSAAFSIPVRGVAGSAGAPMYSFTSDTDTGIYSSNPDQLDFAIAGVQIARFYSVGLQMLGPSTVIYNQSGTAAAPAYTWQSDPDTGFYSLAANHIGVSVNGTRIASFVGNVTGEIQLSNGTLASPSYTFFNDTNTGFYSYSADVLGVSIGGADTMRIGSSVQALVPFIGYNGSNSAPSFAFTSDATSGFFLSTTASIGITLGGTTYGYFKTGSFLATITGVSGTVTGTVFWKRNGSLVTLSCPAGVTGTSNANTLTMTGLPSDVQPSSNVEVITSVVDNGSSYGKLGLAVISAVSPSVVNFLIMLCGGSGSSVQSPATTSFTTSGSKGISSGWQITYTV